ncbi:hypothetical protein ACQ4PT_067190 [Festuca glaucescens]
MSSGTSFRSSQGTWSSRTEDDSPDLRAQMEKRRKRRKESNRESARRSRVRKQQHLDDLSSQVKRKTHENKGPLEISARTKLNYCEFFSYLTLLLPTTLQIHIGCVFTKLGVSHLPKKTNKNMIKNTYTCYFFP